MSYLFVFSSNTVLAQMSNDNLKKKVLFIIVDGISSDQLRQANTPFIDSISNQGSFSRAYVGGKKGAYSETPTVSAVGYNSLLTGTWANKHNVYGNGIKNPNYNYPTIFRLYKNRFPNGKIGVFSSWLDNRTKLVGDALEATDNLKVDYFYDGLEYDTVNYPHDRERNFMKLIDYKVADQTVKVIEEKAPDVSWVYLEFSDDMGHGFGDSERFYAAIQFEDELVGKIWKAIRERENKFNEDWLLIITTDHGRNEKNGKGHGGQSERERSTWIATNYKETNKYFENQIPSIVDILPTMTDFLELDISKSTKREWDGTSLISKAEISNLEANVIDKNLVLTWKNYTSGAGEIYITTTNNFASGGIDNYELFDSVSLDKERVSIPLKKLPRGYFKLVLESPNTSLNAIIND